MIVDDEISFSSSAETCDCERSTFRDEYHGHIITGDLKLITNSKRRSLLSKGPIFREPNAINYNKYKINTDSSIGDCIEKHKTKCKLRDNGLKVWKDFIKQEVSKRIRNLRENNYFYKTSKILNNENVKTFLSKC